MSVGQKLAMLKIRSTSVTFLSLRNLKAAPEEAMQLRRLINIVQFAPSESILTHCDILHVMWSIFEYKVFYEIGLWVNLLVKSIKNVHPLHAVRFLKF